MNLVVGSSSIEARVTSWKLAPYRAISRSSLESNRLAIAGGGHLRAQEQPARERDRAPLRHLGPRQPHEPVRARQQGRQRDEGHVPRRHHQRPEVGAQAAVESGLGRGADDAHPHGGERPGEICIASPGTRVRRDEPGEGPAG